MSAPQNTQPPLRYTELAKLTDEAVMLHLQFGQHDALAVLFDRYHRLALRRLGKEVEYAKYEGEDHSPLYWSYANQVDFCNRLIKWFEKYIKSIEPIALLDSTH